MSLALVLAAFAAATLALLLSLRALGSTGVPVRSASPEAVQVALELLALKDGETFVDLGAGLGNVLRAARRRADVRAIGYELNPFAAGIAALRSLLDLRVRVRCRDSRRANLTGAHALYAYLMPRAMAELGPILVELEPGTRVVSVDFAIPGWTPAETREVGPLHQPVFLYFPGRNFCVDAP